MKKINVATGFTVLYALVLIFGTYYAGRTRIAETPAPIQRSIPIPTDANIYDISYYKDKAKYVNYKTPDGNCYMWSKTSTRNTIRLTKCPTY